MERLLAKLGQALLPRITTLSDLKRRLVRICPYVNLVRYCNYRLPIAVGSLYVRRYFKEEARGAVLDTVSGIRHEFLEILN